MPGPTKKSKNVFEKVSRWWNGEIYKNSPGAEVVYIGRVHTPSAIWAHRVASFVRKEYQFLIGTITAVLGAVASILL